MADMVYNIASTDALVASIEKDDIDGVRRSLWEGADPDAVRGMEGKTALMRAAARKFEKAIVLLIDAGADITRENADGEDAKCAAAAKGYADIVTLINVTARLRDERRAAEKSEQEFRENIEGIARVCNGGTEGVLQVRRPLRLKGGGE